MEQLLTLSIGSIIAIAEGVVIGTLLVMLWVQNRRKNNGGGGMWRR